MNSSNGEDNFLRRAIRRIDSFFNDDTTYYAASLSFFTIFSILPIIALLIAIISSFSEFENYLDIFINYVFNLINPTHSSDIVDALKNYVSNSSKLGFIGVVYMLFVFVMFIRDYVYIVNKIHKAKRKSIQFSFIFYSIFMAVLPLIFAFSNIVMSFYESTIFKEILSYTFAWIIFFALFKLTVNKHIDNKAALISSFITLLALSVTKNLFLYYVISNKTYTTISSSLSTLLFTFFWIYISWIIFLYGVKICHKLNVRSKENTIIN